jgi:hypothetical protein
MEVRGRVIVIKHFDDNPEKLTDVRHAIIIPVRTRRLCTVFTLLIFLFTSFIFALQSWNITKSG